MISKTVLERTIKHYLKHGDYTGAKNYAKNFGRDIKGFDVKECLKNIEEKEEKHKGGKIR